MAWHGEKGKSIGKKSQSIELLEYKTMTFVQKMVALKKSPNQM